MQSRSLWYVVGMFLLVWVGTVGCPSQVEAETSPVIRTLKIVVGAVRYGRHKLALNFFAGQEQGKMLLESHWEKLSLAQQQEFITLFKTLFAKIALRRVEARFKYLKTIVYDKPEIVGEKATVHSTIVILHALKKQELKLIYNLRKKADGWKVLDVTTLGESMLTGIRDEQIRKIMKKGGWERLIQLMRNRVAQLKNVEIK